MQNMTFRFQRSGSRLGEGHRRGAENSRDSAERADTPRFSQRSRRLAVNCPSQTGKLFFYISLVRPTGAYSTQREKIAPNFGRVKTSSNSSSSIGNNSTRAPPHREFCRPRWLVRMLLYSHNLDQHQIVATLDGAVIVPDSGRIRSGAKPPKCV